MLFKEQLKIIELFRLQPFREITLQEIMQKLGKKSYNWTYLAVQKLAKKQILQTRKIGKTIVARLNLENPETLAHLTYSENLKSLKSKKRKIIDDIKQITPFFTLLEHKEKLTIITENKENKKQIEKLEKIRVLTKEEFKKLLIAAGENHAKNLVKDHLVLYGVEIYYAILLEAYRYGIR